MWVRIGSRLCYTDANHPSELSHDRATCRFGHPGRDAGAKQALGDNLGFAETALLDIGERYELQGMISNKARPAWLLGAKRDNDKKKLPDPSRPRDQCSIDVNSRPERTSLPHYSYPFGAGFILAGFCSLRMRSSASLEVPEISTRQTSSCSG